MMLQSLKNTPISNSKCGAVVRCSSLPQSICRALRPGCQSRSISATPSTSSISADGPMAKRPAKIAIRNPFIPASSPVCRAADTALLFSVVLFGVAAALAVLIKGAF